MTTCGQIESLITPFVDGDLVDADRRAVDDHLRQCALCHSRVTAERAVRGLIHARKTALEAPRASESLRQRCSNLSPNVAHVPTLWGARLAPYALAASLVIIVGGAFVYQATDTSARVLAAELTADHVKCFAMNRVLGTRQALAAVESSLASGFGWRAHLPEDLTSAGLELVGARPCLYGEGKIAHVMYRHHGKPVSLFMLPNTSRTQELVEVLGHEAAIWCVGNRTFVLVTRQSKPEVERLAAFVQAGLR